MFSVFALPLEIGTMGETMVAQNYAAGSSVSDIFGSFVESFQAAFTLITSNSALAIILGVSVGLPILGGIVAFFKSR